MQTDQISAREDEEHAPPAEETGAATRADGAVAGETSAREDSPADELRDTKTTPRTRRGGLSRRAFLFNAATASVAFTWGIGAGYWTWGRAPAVQALPPVPTAVPTPEPPQLGLPHSYTLPVAYGRLGPQLIDAGAFTYDGFMQVYAAAGEPLTEEQQVILREGRDAPMVIDHANAYYLLNLLWAFGLTNNNRLLREGAMIDASDGQVDRLASVGGWSLTSIPIKQLYSAAALVILNDAQQADVEEAAALIYRPCCNNPTSFPDCNHGMAMLGLLQLMAARDVDVDGMLEAAKMVNSFWYPAQSKDLALYHQAQTGQGFEAIPAQEAVGPARFSGTGYKEVRAWLVANNRLEAPSQNGSSCGV